MAIMHVRKHPYLNLPSLDICPVDYPSSTPEVGRLRRHLGFNLWSGASAQIDRLGCRASRRCPSRFTIRCPSHETQDEGCPSFKVINHGFRTTLNRRAAAACWSAPLSDLMLDDDGVRARIRKPPSQLLADDRDEGARLRRSMASSNRWLPAT
ncbi:hypothetical protein CDEST_14462 [Colletotrichum destructivum]|uniref:Uncharacterized protein n=1 Tax=Colletotrichum destructivum TaxID=34406 RepID=A0AAX4J208_9PEZI|nr:hypothetical protein CDEST_14462 [Colletotrichum destructivum]